MPIPFSEGEILVYHVAFGFVPAGKAQIEVLGTETINGQLTYAIMSTARSAKGYDWIFKVRDSITTWIDADSLYSHRAQKIIHEGKFNDVKYVEYHLADSLAPWWDDGRPQTPVKVEPRVQDVLSSGFKSRTLPLAVGDTFSLRTHDVKKTYDLLVIVHERDTVETIAGTFSCFKVEPVLRSGGLFNKEKKARVYIWVTDDERRIPVMMQSKVSFGSFTAQLESYTPGKRHRN
jgi:hypothetical protein